MAKITELRASAAQLRTKAQAKLSDADAARAKAASFTTPEDFSQTQAYNDIALKAQQEAQNLVEQAMTYEKQAIALEEQIEQINKQQTDLETNMQAQISKLDEQRKALQ